MSFQITQCKMMINQLFQKLCNINQVNQSIVNLKQLEFQNKLRYLNAKNNYMLSEKRSLDFIEQTQEKLKQLQSRRDEAKKMIESAT